MASGKIAVSEEGVKLLNDLADEMEEIAEKILKDCSIMSDYADSNSATLGPHISSLKSALGDIEDAVSTSTDPVKKIGARVRKVATAYEAIIADDKFQSKKGGR